MSARWMAEGGTALNIIRSHGRVSLRTVVHGLLALLSALFFTGSVLAQTQDGAAKATESTLDVVKRRGTVIIGLKNDYPPAAYTNEKGEWVGFEVELAEYMAKKLGVKLQKELVLSRTRIPMLLNGNVDVFLATLNPTRERVQTIDFSMPYFLSGTQLLTRRDSGIKNVQDLAGRKLGATQGGFDQLSVQAQQPKVEVVFFQEFPQVLLAVKRGIVDALASTDIQLPPLAEADPNLVIVGERFNITPWVMGLRKDDSKWRNAVDDLIMQAWSDGTYARLYRKYIGGEVPYDLHIWPDYQLKSK